MHQQDVHSAPLARHSQYSQIGPVVLATNHSLADGKASILNYTDSATHALQTRSLVRQAVRRFWCSERDTARYQGTQAHNADWP